MTTIKLNINSKSYFSRNRTSSVETATQPQLNILLSLITYTDAEISNLRLCACATWSGFASMCRNRTDPKLKVRRRFEHRAWKKNAINFFRTIASDLNYKFDKESIAGPLTNMRSDRNVNKVNFVDIFYRLSTRL